MCPCRTCALPPQTHIHIMLWVFETLRFSAQVAQNLFSGSFLYEFIPSRSGWMLGVYICGVTKKWTFLRWSWRALVSRIMCLTLHSADWSGARSGRWPGKEVSICSLDSGPKSVGTSSLYLSMPTL